MRTGRQLRRRFFDVGLGVSLTAGAAAVACVKKPPTLRSLFHHSKVLKGQWGQVWTFAAIQLMKEGVLIGKKGHFCVQTQNQVTDFIGLVRTTIVANHSAGRRAARDPARIRRGRIDRQT